MGGGGETTCDISVLRNENGKIFIYIYIYISLSVTEINTTKSIICCQDTYQIIHVYKLFPLSNLNSTTLAAHSCVIICGKYYEVRCVCISRRYHAVANY